VKRLPGTADLDPSDMRSHGAFDIVRFVANHVTPAKIDGQLLLSGEYHTRCRLAAATGQLVTRNCALWVMGAIEYQIKRWAAVLLDISLEGLMAETHGRLVKKSPRYSRLIRHHH